MEHLIVNEMFYPKLVFTTSNFSLPSPEKTEGKQPEYGPYTAPQGGIGAV